jgi:dTDP-4-amino-4,6-dideoxygalactose transaminase
VANRLLPQLDFITQTRIKNAAYYDAAWADIPEFVKPPLRRPGVKHVYHLYMVRAKDRDGLLAFLQQRGIEAKVHYPKPIHLQPAAAYLGYKPGTFPKAEADCRSIITLPAHQHLTREELDFTIHSVHCYYNGSK